MNPFEKLLRRLNPYRGLESTLHFPDDKMWQQFLTDFNPKTETIGTRPWSDECVDTFKIKLENIVVKGYSPHRPNPNFDKNALAARNIKQTEERLLQRRFVREIERYGNPEPPIFEGLEEDAQFNKIIRQSRLESGSQKEVVTRFLSKLKESGWEVSEDSTIEDICKSNMITVRAPKGESWSLRWLPLWVVRTNRDLA